MQQALIFVIFAAAVYYLYRKLIKSNGCNCSSKSGCSTLPKIKPESGKNGSNNTSH